MCWKWLTRSFIVHSNVYGLVNIHCIRYLAAVDSLCFTSSAVQKYHVATSCSVKVPLVTTARNSTSIGEEPVPYSTRISATITKVSNAKQSLIAFTNVLQGNHTVVLVGDTIEYKFGTTWMDEELNVAPESHCNTSHAACTRHYKRSSCLWNLI